jgi:hypothetical protein
MKISKMVLLGIAGGLVLFTQGAFAGVVIITNMTGEVADVSAREPQPLTEAVSPTYASGHLIHRQARIMTIPDHVQELNISVKLPRYTVCYFDNIQLSAPGKTPGKRGEYTIEKDGNTLILKDLMSNVKQVRNLSDLEGTRKLHSDLPRGQSSESTEGKAPVPATLSHKIQEQPAPAAATNVEKPGKIMPGNSEQEKRSRTAMSYLEKEMKHYLSTSSLTEQLRERQINFFKQLTDALIHEGLDLISKYGIDVWISGDFAKQYFDTKSGRTSSEEGLLEAANLSLSPDEKMKNRAHEMIKKLVTEYKIHLMPTDENFIDAVITLCRAIKERKDLQGVIHSIKIKPMLEPWALSNKEHKGLPKIIIYVYGSKDVVQRVLNNIYEVFKDWQGVDRIPTFNEKATSFIYFAQGDRSEKMRLPEYFEEPDLVYFKPDVTGTHEDYHLTNPAKK